MLVHFPLACYLLIIYHACACSFSSHQFTIMFPTSLTCGRQLRSLAPGLVGARVCPRAPLRGVRAPRWRRGAHPARSPESVRKPTSGNAAMHRGSDLTEVRRRSKPTTPPRPACRPRPQPFQWEPRISIHGILYVSSYLSSFSYLLTVCLYISPCFFVFGLSAACSFHSYSLSTRNLLVLCLPTPL